jgi:hypothetical protein
MSKNGHPAGSTRTVPLNLRHDNAWRAGNAILFAAFSATYVAALANCPAASGLSARIQR